MITGMSLQNFRSFEDPSRLPLSPLTCLVGRNSSGKSSLIHALLILRQSVEQRALGSRVPQLNLSGTLLDAGSFEDVVHDHDAGREIGFSFEATIDISEPPQARWTTSTLVDLEVPRPPTTRYWLPGIRTARFLGQRRKSDIRNVSLAFYFRPEPPFGPSLSRLEISVPALGSASFVRTIGERRVQHWRAYLSDLPKRSADVYFPPWSFLPTVRERAGRTRRASPANRSRVELFVACAQLALLDVHLFLSELRVLGPFRTAPARRYAFTGLAAADTGTSGERAVDILITERLIRPGSENLRRAVAFWLQKLGLAKGLRVRDLARKSNMFQLALSGAGAARVANFADVGFGISQVLPVLVQGFLVPRGGTYVVQQPELHLHPDAQAALADYFLYLATQGVRCIVETHSEYLLVRLRRRFAELSKPIRVGIPGESVSPHAIQPSLVSVVHVTERPGASELEVLRIGNGFQFENLPRGFMSQTLSDKLALMKALGKRK